MVAVLTVEAAAAIVEVIVENAKVVVDFRVLVDTCTCIYTYVLLY